MTRTEIRPRDIGVAANRTRALRLALPKGRLQEGVLDLLRAAGLAVRQTGRAYRPVVEGLGDVDTKVLKPQNIVRMLDDNARDVGFAGGDWVQETGAGLVELLDTGLDPVRIVAAAPDGLVEPGGRLPERQLTIATEYAKLAESWARRRGVDARILRTFGATEVFPPEDADLIVDNTATGATLAANGLEIVDEVMASTTRMVASPAALADPRKRASIERLAMLVRSVLDARGRVMLELNVAAADLDTVLEALPSMRQPTVSALRAGSGCAVRSAVPRAAVPELIPRLKYAGAADIVISAVSQLVP